MKRPKDLPYITQLCKELDGQGSCAYALDKLGKQAYGNPSLLYKFRGEVQVPPLQMVDDVISASNCGTQVVTPNAAVDAFTKLKKLQLSETNCVRIHISQSKCNQCPQISVNGRNIKESDQDKYLGDYLIKTKKKEMALWLT